MSKKLSTMGSSNSSVYLKKEKPKSTTFYTIKKHQNYYFEKIKNMVFHSSVTLMKRRVPEKMYYLL